VTLQKKSESSEQTERFGEQLGKRLKGGEAIELKSDLGGGKTTFVRGLARGLGSRDNVGSPTFTICRIYAADRLSLYHFDFYRLQEAGIIADELAEAIQDPLVVTVVEWGEVVHDVLPDDRLAVAINVQADGTRVLEFDCPASRAYLLEGLR